MAHCNTAVNPVLAPRAFKQLCPLTLKVTGLHSHPHTNIPSYLRGPIKGHIENSWPFLSLSLVIYRWRTYYQALSEGVAQVFVLEEAQNNASQAHFSDRAGGRGCPNICLCPEPGGPGAQRASVAPFSSPWGSLFPISCYQSGSMFSCAELSLI